MNTKFFPKLNFINCLRGLHAKNIDGRYDLLIVQAIKKFCIEHFDDLIDICAKDSQIADICALPLPGLEEHWRDKYQVESDNGSNYFLQIVKCIYEPLPFDCVLTKTAALGS